MRGAQHSARHGKVASPVLGRCRAAVSMSLRKASWLLHSRVMPPAAPHAPWTLEGRAPYGEADTRAKLIDPLLYAAGWTEEHIRREETAGGIEVIEGEARRLSKGRVDYTLRFKLSASVQPVALAYIEAKAETKDPAADG